MPLHIGFTLVTGDDVFEVPLLLELNLMYLKMFTSSIVCPLILIFFGPYLRLFTSIFVFCFFSMLIFISYDLETLSSLGLVVWSCSASVTAIAQRLSTSPYR